jgi:hypothetical protein
VTCGSAIRMVPPRSLRSERRKTRHQKWPRETTGLNGNSEPKFPIRRLSYTREMPRCGRFGLFDASAPVETGLDGWGGRIRNIAFRMIIIKLERFRRKAEECKPAP